MIRTPVDPVEQDVLESELGPMATLLEKLTDLQARRQSYLFVLASS